MNKPARALSLIVLIATLLVAGIAATPAQLAPPAAPAVQATGNSGEIVISWNQVPGAQYYTVGWVNWTAAKPLSDAGQDWLSLFHYTTVPGNLTSYTVKGLTAGDDHYGIIRATDEAGSAGRFGGGYSQFSSWSSSPAQPAGQHGDGFCPITGLPLPEGGYLGVGETVTWTDATFTLDSVAIVPSIITSAGNTYTPAHGNRYLWLCSTQSNNTGSDLYFIAGVDNNLSTDAGIGFISIFGYGWLDASPIANGAAGSACDVWVISESATTAVYAIYDGAIETDTVLYRIDLTDIPTSTSTSTTSTSTTASTTPLTSQQLTNLVKPALGQIVATNSAGETGSGTGFVVRSDGLMVTNRHVVDDANTVTVYMQSLDGQLFTYTGTVLGRGIMADLAVVQLPAGTYDTLALADSDEVSGADEVTAWGYPGGSISGTYPTITRGIISSKGVRGDVDFLQTDAAINPGNSGGPLIDAYGRVVGVNTLKTVSERVDNQGFAITSNEVSNRLNTLIAGGRASETYRNTKYGYGYSVGIPQGWYLDDESQRRTVFFPYHEQSWSRIRTYDFSNSEDLASAEASIVLDVLADVRWNESLPEADSVNEWALFEPVSFQEIGSGRSRHYRLEYRRQFDTDNCIENTVEIIVMSPSYSTNSLAFSMMGSVCEDSASLYGTERDAILNSFVP